MTEELKLTIKNEDYYFIKDYKYDEKYRHSLNRLARKTYGFDLEEWYRQGWWGEKYIPFSLLHNEEIVANISVNTMDFLVDGVLKHYLQIGTVMTEEAYRNRGLSRELMTRILKEYEEKYELIYLYANSSVLEFYPKFGFTKDNEYVYSRQFFKKETPYISRQINNKDQIDRAIITRLVRNALPVSGISMVGNIGLIMIELLVFMPESFYYIEDMDLAVAAEYDGDQLLLADVFSEKQFDLDEVIQTMMNKTSMKVTLGFTPVDASGYNYEVLQESDTFFIRGRKPFGAGRFPAMSHA